MRRRGTFISALQSAWGGGEPARERSDQLRAALLGPAGRPRSVVWLMAPSGSGAACGQQEVFSPLTSPAVLSSQAAQGSNKSRRAGRRRQQHYCQIGSSGLVGGLWAPSRAGTPRCSHTPPKWKLVGVLPINLPSGEHHHSAMLLPPGSSFWVPRALRHVVQREIPDHRSLQRSRFLLHLQLFGATRRSHPHAPTLQILIYQLCPACDFLCSEAVCGKPQALPQAENSPGQQD